MDIMTDIVSDLETRTNELTPLIEKAAKLDADIKSGMYTQKAISDELLPARDAAREQIKAAQVAAKKAVADKINAHITDLERLDALNPSELTDDCKLLSSGIPLTESDIRFMLERNANNRSMTQIILRYAHEHDIKTNVAYVDHSEAIKNARMLPGVVNLWIDHHMTTTQALDVLRQMFG